MPMYSLSLGTTVPVLANVVYALPERRNSVSVQAIGAWNASVSDDNSNWNVLVSGTAGQTKTAATASRFIKLDVDGAITASGC